MSDRRLRELERACAFGGLAAHVRLYATRRRGWFCIDCGGGALPPPPQPKLSRRIARRIVSWALKTDPPPPPDPRCEGCALIFRWQKTIDVVSVLTRVMRQMNPQFEEILIDTGVTTQRTHAGNMGAMEFMECCSLPDFGATE